MPGQMPKQVAAQVPSDRHEGIARDPARDPPQQVVRRNQRRQEQEAQPSISGMRTDVKSSRQRVDQNLHAILRAHRTADGRTNGGRDRSIGDRPPPYVAGEKRKGTITVPTSVLHCGRNSPSRLRTRYKAMQWNARVGSGFPGIELNWRRTGRLEATAQQLPNQCKATKPYAAN